MLRDLHKGAGQERGALRAPANQLCHIEDEVAEHEDSQHKSSRHGLWQIPGTHSSPLSCTTLPFNKPLSFSFDGSAIALVETRVGPMGQAPSKPLE